MSAHYRADQALVAKDGDTAVRHFRQCLEINPQNPTAAYGIACAQAVKGDLSEGIAWLEKAVSWGYDEKELIAWDSDIQLLSEEQDFQSHFARMKALRVERTHWGEKPSAKVYYRIGREYPLRGYQAFDIEPGGAMIAAGRQNGVLDFVNTLAPMVSAELSLGNSEVWNCKFMAGGDRLVVLMWSGEVHLLQRGEDGKFEVQTSVQALSSTDDNFYSTEGSILIADNGVRRILVAGAAERGGAILDGDGKIIWKSDFACEFGRSTTLQWSESAGIVGGISEGMIFFVDPNDGDYVDLGLDFPNRATALAFSPNGELLATAHGLMSGGNENGLGGGYICIWDLEQKSLLHGGIAIFDVGLDNVSGMTFSPSGALLHASTISIVYDAIIDVSKGEVLFLCESHHGTIASTPNESKWVGDFVYSARQGGGFINRIDTHDLTEEIVGIGQLPAIIGGNGLLTIDWGGVVSLELGVDGFRWRHIKLATGEELIQSRQGYFCGKLTDLSELDLMVGPSNEMKDLSSLAFKLYDPKRVRAARQGVRLNPVF